MVMVMGTAMRLKRPLKPRVHNYGFRVETFKISRLSVALGLTAFSVAVHCETPRFETSLTVSETFTDNADATKHGRSDWITEISPTVSIRGSGGHVTGSLDASFRNLLYAKDGSNNSSFLALNGNAQVEAIDDSLFIDIASSISRNNLSSFSGRPQWDNQNTSSQSEIRYLSVSPRWVGRIGKSDAQFSLNYNGQALSYGSNMSNQSMGTFHARLFNPTAGERFGWSIDYTTSDNSYPDSNQQNVTDSNLTGTLTFYATPLVSLRLIVGTEENNYMTGQDESGTVTGYGFNWRPTPRTNVDGTLEHHVYGDTYDFHLSHRQALAAYNLAITRDITSAYQTATNSLGSYYYNLFSSSLISQFPDPVQRDQATRELMKALGIPVGGSFGNFATNAFFVDQRIQAGFSLVGARHSLALSIYRSDRTKTNSGDTIFNSSDDFANNDNIKSWGWTVSLSHKLAPTSSLNGALYWSNSEGTGGGPSQDSRNKGLTLGYNKQLTAKTSGTVMFRHETSSGNDGFTENAVTASLFRAF